MRARQTISPSRLAVTLASCTAGAPAWAALPESMASPEVTVAAGLAMMLGLAGGGYLLALRRELASLRSRAREVSPRPAAVEADPPEDDRTHYFRQAEAADGIEGWSDQDGRFFHVSHAVELIAGYRCEEVLAGGLIDTLVYDRDQRYCRELVQRVMQGGMPAQCEVRVITRAGNQIWMACRLLPIRNEAERLLGLRLSMTDIQARKEAEYKLLETVAALRRAQALSEHYLRRSNEERSRLSALLDVVRMGILFMDNDRRVVYCNRAFYEIWGLPAGEAFVGVRDVVLQQRVSQLLEDPAAYLQHVAGVLQLSEPSEPVEIRFKDGRVVREFSRIVPGPEGEGTIGRIWVFEDVTEQLRVADQLMRLAERDPLTSLFNRRRFHEELERMLADGRRQGESVGLLAIDLDGFKPVNDRYGHQAGDEVLVRLATDVGAVIRRNEMFFRLGGDEFAILVPSAGAQELAELARRVGATIAGLRFSFGGESVSVSASVGIALGPRHENDSERLIGAADRAMYLAKAMGGNCWEFARDAGGAELDRTPPAG
ncbi:diguanylate cyclase [Zoogloea sp.]|uniref:sensor domain-containing diguanylate cyclase n=1 Tax=Zoogloea sp. TaxID=49181 RepID=UPI0031FD2072